MTRRAGGLSADNPSFTARRGTELAARPSSEQPLWTWLFGPTSWPQHAPTKLTSQHLPERLPVQARRTVGSASELA